MRSSGTRRTRARGFTAAELLGVILSGAVVAAVAQPVLEMGRVSSFAMSNQAQHRNLATRQHAFILDNDGQFTGPNVTGWPDFPAPPRNGSLFVGETSSSTPVQTQDWITPLVGEDLGLSANRAARTAEMLEQVRDPRQGRHYDALFGNAPDAADFADRFQKTGLRVNSYLSPAAFHYWGTPESGFVPGLGFVDDRGGWVRKYGGEPYNWGGAVASQIETPRGYRPRIEQVGTSLENKAMFADGARFANGNGVVDYDIAPAGSLFGGFLSGFFPSESETSYGRAAQGSPQNILLSARRPGLDGTLGSRGMYITFFDGSTRGVSLSQAKARPEWWAPTGSEWVSFTGIAPEAIGSFEVGDLLP